MKIGFLSVGTEILLGDTVNPTLTNLGKRLYDAGFKLNKGNRLLKNDTTSVDGTNSAINKYKCKTIIIYWIKKLRSRHVQLSSLSEAVFELRFGFYASKTCLGTPPYSWKPP